MKAILSEREAVDLSTFPESDGQPMAETVDNMVQMIEWQYGLRYLLAIQERTNVAVGGNQFIYYNPRNRRITSHRTSMSR